MSEEIKRLHRKQTTFTNFTGNKTNELASPAESLKQDTNDASNEPVRRRRRRRSDSSSETSSISSLTTSASNQPVRRRRRRRGDSSSETSSISSPSISTESTKENVEDDTQDISLMPYSSTTQDSEINTIRAEIRDDAYHSRLVESDFSNDTHDWEGDNQDFSDDYCHFLSSFE